MKLTVKRDTRHFAIFNSFEIFLDGKSLGKLSRNESVTVDVSEGEHQITTKIKHLTVDPFVFNATDGDKTVRMVYNETTFKELYSFNPFKAFANSMKSSAQAFKGKTLSGKAMIEFISD